MNTLKTTSTVIITMPGGWYLCKKVSEDDTRKESEIIFDALADLLELNKRKITSTYIETIITKEPK